MNLLDAVKFVNGAVIGSGASAIAKAVVEKVTPEDVGKATKASMVWAGSAIAGLTAFKATEHIHGQVDEIVSSVKEMFNKDNEVVEVEIVEENVATE